MATREVYKIQVPAGHKVLAVEPASYHVPSDNAMIDSGNGLRVITWDGTRTHSELHRLGRLDCGVSAPAVDATDADRRAAGVYDKVYGWTATVQEMFARCHFVRQGSTVTVTKGRKVPKGDYEVVRGPVMGNYGPYLDLRDKGGREYRYVSVENCRIVPDFSRIYQSDRDATEHAAILRVLMQHEFSEFGWNLVAEFAEDRGAAGFGSGFGDVSGSEFAAALRAVIADSTRRVVGRPSTYAADCHNEMRRPFAGY